MPDRGVCRGGWCHVPASLLLFALGLMPSLGAAATLRVIVEEVTSDKGNVVVWVYAGPERWLSEEVFRAESRPAAGNRDGDSVTLEIELPPGEYALSVFQDLDADGKLKRTFIGIPKEPAGLSNNVVPRFGPPKYKDAKFQLDDAGAEQRIRLD